MRTREIKAGLILAFLLGLSDIAILFALLGDGDHPPVAIWVTSVILGILTLWAVVTVWKQASRLAMAVLVVTRLISALGDIAGFSEDTAIVVISAVLLVLSIVCLYLLRSYFSSLRRNRPVVA